MHDNPGHAWTLDRMAEYAGMSRTAFANTFREVVGQTPGDYLGSWRIALAQGRLREGRPMKILAEELGYANPSALSRAFTRSEEHTSELQSLMRISYAVFCLKKNTAIPNLSAIRQITHTNMIHTIPCLTRYSRVLTPIIKSNIT